MRALVALVAFGCGCFLVLFPLVFVATGIFVLAGGPNDLDPFVWTARTAQGSPHGYLLHGSILVWIGATAHAAQIILGRTRVAWVPRLLER